MNNPRSLREAVYAIDNDKDFSNYMSSFGSKVPPRSSDIRYERSAVSGVNNYSWTTADLRFRFSTPHNSQVLLLLNVNRIQQHPTPLAKVLHRVLRLVPTSLRIRLT
jgi:hypothetical protein